MSDVPKRRRRASVLSPIVELKSPKESRPKSKTPVKRSNKHLTTVKEKKKPAAAPRPKKQKLTLTIEDRARRKYPDSDFDPIKEREYIFESDDEEEFSEEQIEEEKARLEIGIEKVLARKKIPLSKEFADFIADLKSKGVRDDNTTVAADASSSSDEEDDDDVSDEEEEEIEALPFECDNEEYKIEPTRMKFFMPIPHNVPASDRLLLSNTPLVHDETDDYRLCRSMYELFDGIHGYIKDKYQASPEQIFEVMTDLLPGTKNPDLFYYVLYLIFPNHGSQEVFSHMYPDLVKLYVNDKEEQKRLLKLEHWKTPENMKKEKKFQEPADFKNPFSHGNFLSKSIKMPSGDSKSVCSENCYHSITRTELVQLTGGISRKSHQMKIFIPKTTKKDCDFLNTLILEDSENDLVDNFCQIAGRFDSNTCSGWFRSVMAVNEQPGGEELDKVSPKKTHKERERAFRHMMAKETSRLQKEEEGELQEQDDEDNDPKQFQRCAVSPNVLNTKACLTPCCHLGPCGQTNKFCSCDTMCSIYCQCDADCGRRFWGCRCGPNQCRSGSCPCFKLAWECIPTTCKSCTDVDHPEDPEFFGCKNKSLSYNVAKNVTIGKSGIAGNGAFIREDVKKDEFIGEYTGEYISEEETERRGGFYNLKISYIFSLGNSSGSIDACRGGSSVRFLNHSSNPNCYIKQKVVRGLKRIGFFAGQDITSGTELTIDYAYAADDEFMFFNIAPQDRIPKYDNAGTSTSEKNEKSRARKSILKEDDDDVDIEVRRTATITRFGRRSVRFENNENPNEPSTSQPSGSDRH